MPVESPSDKEADHNVPAKLADATGHPLSRRRILRQWAHLVRPVILIRAPYVPVPTGKRWSPRMPDRKSGTNRATRRHPKLTNITSTFPQAIVSATKALAGVPLAAL